MVRWMCGTSEREKKSSAELRNRMGIEAIYSVLKRNRLRWFGHVDKSVVRGLVVYPGANL